MRLRIYENSSISELDWILIDFKVREGTNKSLIYGFIS